MGLRTVVLFPQSGADIRKTSDILLSLRLLKGVAFISRLTPVSILMLTFGGKFTHGSSAMNFLLSASSLPCETGPSHSYMYFSP